MPQATKKNIERLIKPRHYFQDNDLPIKQYYEQFETPKTLEVGKVYRSKGYIYWIDYKILYIGEGVALGLEVANGNGNFSVGKKELFYSDGYRLGWKYDDFRPVFRLVREV